MCLRFTATAQLLYGAAAIKQRDLTSLSHQCLTHRMSGIDGDLTIFNDNTVTLRARRCY
jgi:hypothetical protein